MVPAGAQRPEVSGWRGSQWLAAVELLLVTLVFVGDYLHLVPPSKTPFLLGLAWISLRLGKLRWRDVGLRLYQTWPVTLGLGFAAGSALKAFQLLVSQPFLVRVLGKQPDLELFRTLHGNLQWTLPALVGSWTLAAIGEDGLSPLPDEPRRRTLSAAQVPPGSSVCCLSTWDLL